MRWVPGGSLSEDMLAVYSSKSNKESSNRIVQNGSEVRGPGPFVQTFDLHCRRDLLINAIMYFPAKFPLLLQEVLTHNRRSRLGKCGEKGLQCE